MWQKMCIRDSRNTLWNAAEAVEKQWNSQLARRIVLAIPREIPPEQHADLIRDYCREFFVSKGMIADCAIHDKGDGNPHAHILLKMCIRDSHHTGQPRRGQDLLCHAPCGGLYQPKAFARYGDP